MEMLDVVGLLSAAKQLERNVAVSLMYSGLRIPQFRLLDMLSELGQATVTEMSKKMSVTRATASVMVNELIRLGAVTVVEHDTDRRSYHIMLTELGMNKLHVARSDLSALRNKMSARYSDEMIRMLNEFASEAAAR